MSEGLPSIADGREYRLDPNSIKAARLTGAITGAVVSAVSLIVMVTVLLGAAPGRAIAMLALAGWIALVAVLCFFAFYWPAVRYRYASYRVDERGLRIRRGVLWRTEISLPRSRVQHTDVSRGPIERGFELATLVVHTAGTENASVALSGLESARAYSIRDYLIEGGEGDAV